MKIHRFIDNFDLSKKEVEITGEIARQIIKVLKLKVGEKIELADGKGISAMAEIVEIKNKTVIVNNINTPLRSTSFAGQYCAKKTSLFCAVLKKENFELVVQKATETGISKIIPIISARTVKTGLNIERLKKIAKEASEQSGRNTVPEISEPISFGESLELISKDGDIVSAINILFDKNGQKLPPPTPSLIKEGVINIFIGPEGGWTEEEIKKAQSLDFKILSLGKMTLRAETAAIIATYLSVN